MTEPSKPNNQDQSKKKVKPVTNSNLAHNQKQDSLSEYEKASNATHKTTGDKPIGVNILSYNQKKDWYAITAIIVSCIAVCVSLWLAIVTYRLYNIAASQSDSVIKAGDAAQSSAIIAKNTIDETKRYNREYLKLQKDAFDSNTKSEEKREDRDRTSLNAQITSLKETQKDFEIENRPYIQFQSVSIDTLKIGVKPIIRASIGNLGKYPAKIFKVSIKVRVDPGKELSEKDFTGEEMISEPNTIIANNTTITFNFLDKTPLSEDNFKYLTTGKESFFISGKIYYLNFLNMKKVVNNFIYKIDIFPGLSVVAIKNDIK